MNEIDQGILVLLKQQRERPKNIMPEWGIGTLSSAICRWNVLPVELSGQLGAGRCVGRL